MFDQRTTLFLSAVSAVSVVALTVGMIVFAFEYGRMDHFDRESFLSLKASFREDPSSEALANAIRVQDVFIREQHLRYIRRVKYGGLLLLGSMIALALCLRRLASLREQMPRARRAAQIESEQEQYRFKVITMLLVVILPVLLILFVAIHRPPKLDLSVTTSGLGSAVLVASSDEPVSDDQKWPQLFGFMGTRRIPDMDVPTNWDAATGENLLWKADIPIGGNSSPVVWGNKAFVTGADLQSRHVYCFDTRDGSLVWTCRIQTDALLGADFRLPAETGLASPTVATDGTLVYAFFGTNELAAVDFNGQMVWSRWFGKPESIYGIATSPIVHDGKIILQLDQGDADENISFLYALNTSDGKELWKTPRDNGATWTSPVISESDGQTVIVTTSDPYVIGYDLGSGRELWRVKALSGDVAPVPTVGGGMVFVTTQYAPLSAIRLGGSGDVTETHVAWSYDGDTPDVSSPLTDGLLLILANGYGTVVCFDAVTGEEIWKEEFRQGFWSSPVLVGDKVFLTDMDGKTFIFMMERSYVQKGVGSVGEFIGATPAFADSRIFIRSQRTLYCLGKK